TEGELFVGGRRVTGPQTNIGMVFQGSVLVDWRSVLGNVMLQIEMRGLRRRDYLERARALLRSVGLLDFADRHPYELSGGMQQRLAWGRYSRLFVFFVIGLFALWQAIVVGLGVPRYILPAPSEIYVQFIRNFVRIAGYTLVTGGESFVGFFVAVAIGVPLGVVVAFSSALRKTFYPLAVTLEMVPKIAFAPMFVTWMGFGYAPKV